jgi:hypothetical protein
MKLSKWLGRYLGTRHQIDIILLGQISTLALLSVTDPMLQAGRVVWEATKFPKTNILVTEC